MFCNEGASQFAYVLLYLLLSCLFYSFLAFLAQLAVKVEELQKRFDWRTLYNVVFEEVPVAQWPSEHRLHLLMSLVAQVGSLSCACGCE